jgi:hypothetical protein
MALFALSVGQLVLTSSSTIIAIAILFFSVLNSIWVNTAAAGLTVIFHLVITYRSLVAIRRAKKDMSISLTSITDTTCSIAVGTVLASVWIVCFALTIDITLSGPTMNMGMMVAASGGVAKHAAIRQLVLTAVESLLMVAIVVLAVQERRALKARMDDEGYDYPTKPS